jgi:hypothetical protein
MERRRFKQTTSLKERVASFAEEVREKAARLRPGPERDALLKKIRQADRRGRRAHWQRSPRRRCLAEALRLRAYSGQSLQSIIPIMIIEPAATASEQITGNSSRTATTPARPLILFPRAKRRPAAPIRKLRLAPSSSAV